MADKPWVGKVFSTLIIVVVLSLIAFFAQQGISASQEHERKMKSDPAYRSAFLAEEFKKKQEAYKRELAAWEQQHDYCRRYHEERMPYVDKYLSDKKQLRKMSPHEAVTYNMRASGSIFLFFGSYEAEAEGKHVLMERFSWKNVDGIFVNSELPFKKFRESLDPKSERPTVTFVWKEHPDEVSEDARGCWSRQNQGEEFYIENCLKYALITCKPEEWEENIKLPLNYPK